MTTEYRRHEDERKYIPMKKGLKSSTQSMCFSCKWSVGYDTSKTQLT